MYLGIEIGGTKLQLAIGAGDGSPLVDFHRAEIRLEDGAGGILRQIETIGREMIERHQPRAIGIGFGGPVDAEAGRTITSHQVEGWTDFALVDWCRETFGLPAGALQRCRRRRPGRGPLWRGPWPSRRLLYHRWQRHRRRLGGGRPRLLRRTRDCLGDWPLAARLGCRSIRRRRSSRLPAASALPQPGDPGCGENLHDPSAADLLARCGGRIEQLSGRMVADAAAAGNAAAQRSSARALQTLGWAIAQMITLLAPQVVVIGGGVPRVGEALFFAPLRKQVARYVFPPLAHSYSIVPAELGEEVVVHGALAVTRDM